jgi:hypothetical protein
MQPLYKYVTEERFAVALMEQGQVYMQTLAAFQAYEDSDVRRDQHEGSLHFQPPEGLKITKQDGQVANLHPSCRLVSAAETSDIYAYCLSTKRSEALAEQFSSPFCIEITNPMHLIARIKNRVSLRSQLARGQVYHGPVEYRSSHTPPIVKWALPEQISFVKPEAWGWQCEYRIVVGRKGVFEVENVQVSLQSNDTPHSSSHIRDPLILTVGSLSRITSLHKF